MTKSKIEPLFFLVVQDLGLLLLLLEQVHRVVSSLVINGFGMVLIARDYQSNASTTTFYNNFCHNSLFGQQIVSGGDMDPHKIIIFSTPLTTCYAANCSKSCVKYGDTSIARITAPSNSRLLAWCRTSLIAASVAFIWWR